MDSRVSIRSRKSHDCLLDGIAANRHRSSDTLEKSREWTDIKASSFARNTLNPIRKFVEDAELQPNPEKNVISLSIGDPTIFGNLEPCKEIVNAVQISLKSMKYHGYIPSVGTCEARKAVARYSSIGGLEVNESDVILTCGASHALELCVMCFCEPGENILIPRPGFSVYKTHANSVGIETRFYDLDPTRSWQVDLRTLRSAVDSKTRAIVINNPSNPCGSVFSKDHLEEILEVAKQFRLPIIADEIYEHFVFPGLTKRFLVPGWRTGWIVIHDRNGALKSIRKGLVALCQKIMGGNALIHGAIKDILENTPRSFFNETIAIVKDNAVLAFNALSSIPGMKPIMPQGAMYMMVGVDLDRFKEFPDDTVFCKELFRKESVFCMPGIAFSYPNYFRIVLTVPRDTLLDACDRISAFCEHHAKYFS